MIDLLRRRRHFRRLWLSAVVSSLGSWLSYVAIAVVVVREQGGALGLASVLAAHLLPVVLLAPVAGRLADRLDRRRLLIATDLARVLLTLAMATAAFAGALIWLQALLALRVFVGALHQPAAQASVPRLVDVEEVALANRVDTLTWSVMFAVGAALGGLLSAAVGPVLALVLDAGTFLASALLLRGLPSIRPRPHEGAPARGGLAEAWRWSRSRPPVRHALRSMLPVALIGGGAWLSLNLRAFEVEGLLAGAAVLGLLQATRAVGTGLGPGLTAWLSRRLGRPIEASGDLMALAGAGALAFAVHPLAIGAAVFLWGLGGGHTWVWTSTRLQLDAPDALRGRLMAMHGLASSVGMLSGATLGASLVELGAPSGASAGAMAGLAALYYGARVTRSAVTALRSGQPQSPMASSSSAASSEST